MLNLLLIERGKIEDSLIYCRFSVEMNYLFLKELFEYSIWNEIIYNVEEDFLEIYIFFKVLF